MAEANVNDAGRTAAAMVPLAVSAHAQDHLYSREIGSFGCVGAEWRLMGARLRGEERAVAPVLGHVPRTLAVQRSPLGRLHEPRALAALEVLAAPPTSPTTNPR